MERCAAASGGSSEQWPAAATESSTAGRDGTGPGGPERGTPRPAWWTGPVPRPSRASPAAVLAAACAAFVGLGLREAALGVAWPSVQATFHQPLSALGLLLACVTAGYLVASLGSGRLAGRWGAGPALVCGAAVGALGLAAMALAPAWAVFVSASVIVGLSAGLLDAGLNTVVALRHGVRGLGVLHAAFGLGAIFGPLIMAAVVASSAGWRAGYGVLLAVYLVAVAGLLVVPMRREEKSGEPVGPPGDERPPVGALPLAIALFFVYVGVEVTAGQWAYSLFTEARGMGTVASGVWVAGFWAAFTGGRVLTGLGGHRLAGEALIDVSLALATVGAALLWWAPTDALGGAGLVVLGLGLAAVFPSLVALTPQRLGADRAPSVIGYQVAAAAVGAAALPSLFGILAEHFGLELLGPILLVGLALLALLHRWAVASDVNRARALSRPARP